MLGNKCFELQLEMNFKTKILDLSCLLDNNNHSGNNNALLKKPQVKTGKFFFAFIFTMYFVIFLFINYINSSFHHRLKGTDFESCACTKYGRHIVVKKEIDG